MVNILICISLICLAVSVILQALSIHFMQKTMDVQNARLTMLIEKVEELKKEK